MEIHRVEIPQFNSDRQWTTVLETTIYCGITFSRTSSWKYSAKNGSWAYEHRDETHEKHFTRQRDDSCVDKYPDVICGRCGEANFQIRFEPYRVLARCTVCGFEAVVHD